MAKTSDQLLTSIREGRQMTQGEKLRLIVSLSIPSILAQISATVMFFIDASMVGHLGARASAAIGLVETTTWLLGGLASAANMGFSVQVAHFIGANDFVAARRVLRQSLVCCLLWSLMLALASIAVHSYLPYWLGGSEEIAHDASLYFMFIGIFGIFFQMEGLAGSMLKCSGNMKIPSMLNIMMCVLDVVFNYGFIYVLNMGVVGAALGTGLAELITAILMLYFLLYRSKMLGICRGDCEQMTVGVGSSDEQDTAADNQRERVLSESEGLSESRSLSESEGLSENRILSENRGQSENRRDSENKRQSENREQSVYRRGKILSEDNSFRPQADVVRTAFRIGAPMGLQHMLMGGAQVVSTIIVAPLGTVAIAANSLAITVESLCYMPGYGIAEAATTLVGQSIGAGQRLMTRSFAYMSVGLGMLVMTLMGVLMWVFAPELMGIMSPVEEIIAQGTEVLRIEAWAEPMFAAAIVCNGVFIGAADTLIPAVMSLTSMWCVRLSLAALLARDYGLRGVWIAMAIELTFRGLLFLTRLFRGKWAMEKVPTGKR